MATCGRRCSRRRNGLSASWRAGQLSLRELARQVGVSHGAPRRHFSDRQALLDALAEAGFARLGGELRTAADGAGEDFEARLQATGGAYVRFATQRRRAARADVRRQARRGVRRRPPGC